MSKGGDEPAVIVSLEAEYIDRLEPLWSALHAHHMGITPRLGGADAREPADAWARRREKYRRWLAEPDSFTLVAERTNRRIGYAFVTVGLGHASWRSGDRIAELETLSVLPEERNRGVGTMLVDAVEQRLRAAGIHDLQITSAITNADSHRFYERRGLTPAFVTFYGSIK